MFLQARLKSFRISHSCEQYIASEGLMEAAWCLVEESFASKVPDALFDIIVMSCFLQCVSTLFRLG